MYEIKRLQDNSEFTSFMLIMGDDIKMNYVFNLNSKQRESITNLSDDSGFGWYLSIIRKLNFVTIINNEHIVLTNGEQNANSFSLEIKGEDNIIKLIRSIKTSITTDDVCKLLLDPLEFVINKNHILVFTRGENKRFYEVETNKLKLIELLRSIQKNIKYNKKENIKFKGTLGELFTFEGNNVSKFKDVLENYFGIGDVEQHACIIKLEQGTINFTTLGNYKIKITIYSILDNISYDIVMSKFEYEYLKDLFSFKRNNIKTKTCSYNGSILTLELGNIKYDITNLKDEFVEKLI